MDTKGGRFSLAINGQVFSGRASAKLMLSGVSPTVGVNMDGTAYRTIAPKLVGIDLTFDRGKLEGGVLKWDSTMLLTSIDVTFTEVDVGVTHLFTSASWDGDPTIDTATGEVSGLKAMTGAANYQSYKS